MTGEETIERELGRMAAVARLTPIGTRDSKGRLLPIRYRLAERRLAEIVAARATL
jgi:hypothetical protein